MRQINPASIAKLHQKIGGEWIIILKILWNKAGGWQTYGDKFIKGVCDGRILEVADLEAIIDINNSGATTSFNVKLDDTDAHLKNIFNYVDIHSRPVRVYQWNTVLPPSDMFLLFEGHVASPIVWNEGDRTLSFDILSSLTDTEVGFSIEEGQFTDLPKELIGVAWPLIFGEVHNLPTVEMDSKNQEKGSTRPPHGYTMIDLGIGDARIQQHMEYIKAKQDTELGKAACYARVGAHLMFEGDLGEAGRDVFEQGQKYKRQAQTIYNGIGKQMQNDYTRFMHTQTKQRGIDATQIPIMNGHFFRQGVQMTININGAKYTGTFSGDTFNVAFRMAPHDMINRKPKTEEPVEHSTGSVLIEDTQEHQDKLMADFLFGVPIEVNTSERKSTQGDPCTPPNYFPPGKPVDAHVPTSDPPREGQFFFAPAGTEVSIDGDSEELGNSYPARYIVGITPGIVVISVNAENNGRVIPVPPSYYTIGRLDYDTIQAVIITFPKALSLYKDQGWSDKVYCDVSSAIGPNMVDIMIWLIQTYTSYGIDTASFFKARIQVDPYPMNFALSERKNIITLLKEMAYQGRCAIWAKEGIFYLKYLPFEGNSVDTLTEHDVEASSLEVTTTTTEDLITKYVAEWKSDYSRTENNLIILRYNVSKYGIHEERYNYYCYTDEYLVDKSATFWMIRRANIFKILKCKTFITKLKVETMDTITLAFQFNWIANVNVNGLVQKSAFNSNDLSISFEIWTPVRLGEMYPYAFAYPAGMSKTVYYPPLEDVQNNLPGGDGPGSHSSGDYGSNEPLKPIQPAPPQADVQTFTRPRDLGTAFPGDQGDIAPPITFTVPTWSSQAQGFKGAKGMQQDYNRKQYAGPPPVQDFISGRAIPGIINSKGSAAPDGVEVQMGYNATLYPLGAGGSGGDGIVIQLFQAQDEEIPANTWIIASRTIWWEQGKPVIRNYIQVPTWLSDKDSST